MLKRRRSGSGSEKSDCMYVCMLVYLSAIRRLSRASERGLGPIWKGPCRVEGRKDGRKEGRMEGRKEGWKEGWKDGWKDGWMIHTRVKVVRGEYK
ncbi:hypothetical protein K504DRAFT_249820 [Pleomassaria siparia CBS 279.74]|uniref:Essential protein Yae1 N-terminal domain-containing protein n=1 Tax=Pleomassaria siparia CBS 279.74 TaxID=1314801 RepID=A0A6G1KC54_9PLEO|nr:hypothetical protein K504DRAFT_249820 [Pleomassaria siparia CBS 279.74]